MGWAIGARKQKVADLEIALPGFRGDRPPMRRLGQINS